MDSDSDDNNFSRFSVNSAANDSKSHQSIDQSDQNDNETTNDSVEQQSDQGDSSLEESSEEEAGNDFIDDAADESVIIKPKKKNMMRRILDSDSESDEKSEPEDESEKKSESESDKDSDDSFDQGEENSNDDNSDEENVSADQNNQIDLTNLSLENQSDRSNGSKQRSNRVSDRLFKRNSANGKRRSVNTTNDSDSSLVNTSPSLVDSVTIPETDDEDEEEDEDEKERSQIHCFSPRTRRSITGRRPIKPSVIDSDEDDDEIFTNDVINEENVSSSDYKSAEASSEYNGTENFKRNRSLAPNDSTVIKTPNAKRFSINTSNFSSSTPSKSHTSQPDIEFSDKSDVSRSSSIQITSSHSDKDMKSILSDSSSVVLLNSSNEENHKPYADSTTIDFKGVGSSTPGTSGKLVQPKLPFGRQPLKSSKKFVSRDYYNKKSDELVKLKQEQLHNSELYERMGLSLPDKGENLKRRVKKLILSVQKLEEEIANYAIEEDHLDEVMIVEPTNNNQQKNVAKDWRDDLESIQPRWTGQQGLSTFNTQKTLTLNRIEKLHKAMSKCPTESDLARQPDHLNVQLMPHQLHAIKWMRWRETQKPKGGVLADDMGLGKTLTMIGLVLDAKYRKNLSTAEEDEEENTEDEQESDDENDRSYKKSYQYQGGTLIICPASLINQWEHEVNNRVKRRKLSVLLMHGNTRKESVHSICKFDLVITTYGIVTSDHKSNGPLFKVRWERIVLDEAHMIRNHTTGVSKGCCDLRGNMRWGLTGTPIQNKHMDVYSMLKFLRVTPFDDLPTFKKWIDPKTQAGMSRLHNILKPMLLRRTKAELQNKGELQALPSKTIIIEDIQLTVDEASIYTKILAYSQTLFAQYMDQHQQRNGGGRAILPAEVQRRLDQVKRFGGGQDVKSSQILVLLLRLRQICDHPGLIHQMLQDECDLEDCEDEEDDSVDMNIVKQMIGLKINKEDDEEADNSSDDETKPTSILSSNNKMYDFKQPSSKCQRVIDIVNRILKETNDKIVVVSQWTSFLSIVADLLHRERVHYVELTGKTPIKDRNNIVVSFNDPNTPERVMMLSLVAGGVGLNLTGANHLILLDPHWNPQLESQAFDRVYRVGQTKDVHIYKLLCIKTVEKHIQSIQENKLALSDNVLTGSKSSGTKLSIQDMRQLFDM